MSKPYSEKTPEEKKRQLDQQKLWRTNNKDKAKAIRQKGYIKNRDKNIARAIVWQKANPDRRKEIRKASDHKYYLKNKERRNKETAIYRKANIEKTRTINRKARRTKFMALFLACVSSINNSPPK